MQGHREWSPWLPMNGDPNSDWDERSFKNEGMAYVDEKYVVMLSLIHI